jgi:hypothetical protein
METVKNLVAGASETVASAAQSAKESLTGVQEKVRAVQQHVRSRLLQAAALSRCMSYSVHAAERAAAHRLVPSLADVTC